MTQQAIFVHGSSVVMEFPGGGGVGFPQFTPGHAMDYVSDQPWTDITGSRTGTGAVFHGRSGTTNTFVFSIPTPAVTFGVITGPRTATRASLTKMFVMYSVDDGVRVTGVTAFDGGRHLTDHAGNPVGI